MQNLTEMQEAFVLTFTSAPGAIGNASEAARQAGFSPHTAREQGRQLLHKPHVQAALRDANQKLLSGQIATKAVAHLEKVIDDESAPIKVRVEAAKTVLDRGGFGAAPAGQGKREGEKHPSEMNQDELFAHMAELRKVIDLEKRAAPIDVTPEPQLLPAPIAEGLEPCPS